jgi:hypothetical protein
MVVRKRPALSRIVTVTMRLNFNDANKLYDRKEEGSSECYRQYILIQGTAKIQEFHPI